MAQETAMGGDRSSFHTTLWTEVLDAAGGRREALERFIEGYWRPLYAFARRRGIPVETAKDRVQEFFTRLIEKDWLSAADPDRGRFRAFLKTAFVRFMANESDRDRALKRGGTGGVLSLDFEDAERRLTFEPSADPGVLFDRDWAMTLLGRALAALERECAGKEYALLQASMDAGAPGTEALAGRFGLQHHTVKNMLFRTRRRLRELMEREVAALVADPRDVKAELAALQEALG